MFESLIRARGKNMYTMCCRTCKNYDKCLKQNGMGPPPLNTTCCEGCDYYDETKDVGTGWWCGAPKFFQINPKTCYK